MFHLKLLPRHQISSLKSFTYKDNTRLLHSFLWHNQNFVNPDEFSEKMGKRTNKDGGRAAAADSNLFSVSVQMLIILTTTTTPTPMGAQPTKFPFRKSSSSQLWVTTLCAQKRVNCCMHQTKNNLRFLTFVMLRLTFIILVQLNYLDDKIFENIQSFSCGIRPERFWVSWRRN